jgi:hypothetical protein
MFLCLDHFAHIFCDGKVLINRTNLYAILMYIYAVFAVYPTAMERAQNNTILMKWTNVASAQHRLLTTRLDEIHINIHIYTTRYILV